MSLRCLMIAGAVLLLSSVGPAGRAWAAAPVDFSRDIRPLLSDRCFQCHGPEEATREGGFRLDIKESAFGEAESGKHPIVPGKVEASGLIARITSEDEDERMPSADSNKTLSKEEIELLRAWVEQGAQWKEHWSLVVPRRADLPNVKNEKWARHPMDRFVLARVEQAGLSPSAEADRATLIRRVTFDLTGLPPTSEETDAFTADGSDEAYERLVDRLLESPRYGEHMARFWLDAARYGDTHGLHLDNYREMWPYRDWVIRAMNDNMPYDQFTIEQLAGDLLPHPTLDQRVATGFDRANVTTNEGGSIKEEVYVRNVVDRVVTTGTVFMGMTLECTRCHDHKFDPFTMNDFYSMFAYFNSLDGNPMDGNKKDPAPVVRVPSAEQTALLADLDGRIKQLQAKVSGDWPEIDQLQLAWEAQLIADQKSTGEAKADAPKLGNWYVAGPFVTAKAEQVGGKQGPEGKPVKLDETFAVAGKTVKWAERTDLADGRPHAGLPAVVGSHFLYRTMTTTEAKKVTVSLGSDDGIKVYLNNKQVFIKDIARGVAADQDKVELSLAAGENHLLIKIMNYGGAAGFYFSMSASGPAHPANIVALLKTPVEKRSAQQKRALRDYYRGKIATAKPLKRAKADLAKATKDRASAAARVPTTLVWKETKTPRAAFYLKRGQYDQRGDQVQRRTPLSLPRMKAEWPNDRLGFARWLVDPSHPLTARVAVNRLWLQVFGTGIVKTAEDFGSQGQPPSHPRLLDTLAVQFIEDGWDVKAMMKRLVTSATYRQSSRVTKKSLEIDPDNRLLSRGPRFRLDAEMLRDQALFVSGLLVEKIGGPSVKPPQPGGLWLAVGYSGSNTVRFKADTRPDQIHRRTLYTFLKRTSPPPEMSILDAPSRESCVVRRERTNTPLQALLLLNDPQYVEAARALAERTMRDGGNDTVAQATSMFRRCVCRNPSAADLADLVKAYDEEFAYYSKNVEAAKKLVSVGSMATDAKLAVSQLAAWTMTANLLLNLDEVVTKN